MPDAKTDLTVRAKSEGFAKLRDEAGRLNDDLKEGAQNTKRGFEDAERSMTGFERAMGRAMKAVASNKEATRALRDIGGQFDKLQKQVEGLEKSFKRADEARGSFFQGLAQGAGVGEYIQRGPGMYRQIAGRFAGRAAAGPFRAAQGGLFQGVSGFAQGLASIPGGGLLTAPMMQAIGMAGQSLQFQQAQFQTLPTLGGAGLARRMAAARRNPRALALAARAAEEAGAATVSEADINRRMPGRAETPGEGASRMFQNLKDVVTGDILAPRRRGAMLREYEALTAGTMATEGDREKARARAEAGIRASRSANAAAIAERQAREGQAREVRQSFYSPIRRAGLRFGAMGAQQANQFAQQLAAAGGTLDPRAMMPTAVAAQTAFGVGGGVSGAFLRAGRRGGIAGGGGGAAALTQALGEGMRLGLEGSELTRFMEEMAQGISRFEQTGIPINPRSVGGIARAVSVLGVGATRGQRIAQGLVGAGQRLAQQGPQTAMDVLMLQGAGFQGGGLESLMDAMMALEQGLTGPQATAMMQALVQAGGGGAGGIFTLQRGLARVGVNIGLGEAKQIAGELRGGQPGAGERIQAIVEEQRLGARAAPATPKQIQNLAKTIVDDFGPNLKRQAGLTNKQIDVGRGLITTMQNFQETTTTMADTFAKNAKPLLEGASEGMLTLSKKIAELIEVVKARGLAGAIGSELQPR